MALGKFELDDWGPKKLRQQFKKVADRLNQITPIAGCGLKMSEEPEGVLIEADMDALVENVGNAQAGGGNSVAVYGAVNGAPGIFHLLQSSPPTLVP